MSASSNQDSLWHRIKELEVASDFDRDNQTFVPEGELDKVLTEEAILHALRLRSHYNDDDDEEEDVLTDVTPDIQAVASFTHQKAKKLFAIVVRGVGMEKLTLYRAMRGFRARPGGGFTDSNLPVPPLEGPNHILITLNSGQKGVWKDHKIEQFYNSQWKFLAATFQVATPDKFNHDFEKRRLLPFTKKFKEQFQRGGFGEVCKYQIHPNHLRKPDDTPAEQWEMVAVKAMLPGNKEEWSKMEQDWEKEAKILQEMSALQQPHIVQFITAFRRGDSGQENHYLMFEWAEGGNLRNLWKTYQRKHSTPTAPLVKQTLKQILGLATALRQAHYPEFPNVRSKTQSFRHGDLKPENILWFKDGNDLGLLKIADWGLAKAHGEITQLRNHKTSTEWVTRRYEAPEEETGTGVSVVSTPNNQLAPGTSNTVGKKRSRLFDIWAMGCITLEFIVWLLYGLDGLDALNNSIRSDSLNFTADRSPFYQTIKRGEQKIARVHDEAVRWMDHMASLPDCKPGRKGLGSLLEVVRTCLLVVRLPENLGTSEDVAAVDTSTPLKPPFPQPEDLDESTFQLTVTSAPPDGDTVETVTGSTDDNSRAGNLSLQQPTNSKGFTFSVTPPSIDAAIQQKRTKNLNDDTALTIQTQMAGDEKAASSRIRVRSDDFVRRLEEIWLEDHDDDSFWTIQDPDPPLPPGVERGSYQSSGLSNFSTRNQGHGASLAPTATISLLSRLDYGKTELDMKWEHTVDNDFAQNLMSSVSNNEKMALPRSVLPTTNLCDTCNALRTKIWTVEFKPIYYLEALQEADRGRSCDLCSLLWRVWQSHGGSGNITKTSVARFWREGSCLKLESSKSADTPVLSIVRSPDFRTRIDSQIQIGLPQLSDPGAEAHFEVLRLWLKSCDAHHQCMSHGVSRGTEHLGQRLPTRVIDVGAVGDPRVRLIETSKEEVAKQGKWLALSHQWGPKPHFCTTVGNVREYLSNGMLMADLEKSGKTFADAIAVTRALNYRYLWIDSLCIVQGKGGDFKQEMKRMEQVYTGADCVLGLSRREGHNRGFLEPRDTRQSVTLAGDGAKGEFHICEYVDSFQAEVLDGPLSRRGWVMQERALARRTIFFTDKQAFWECGQGIRCESGSRLKNQEAAFLGDSKFPEKLLEAHQAAKILMYQGLFNMYTRLALTEPSDRPTAVDGLQDRILRALDAKGAFGVLDQGGRGQKFQGLLRRSLLWCRGCDTAAMNPIKFEEKHAISSVPSWSWMAYTGGIAYVDPPFGYVEWAALRSPWSGQAFYDRSLLENGLVIEAYEYVSSVETLNVTDQKGEFIFDRPEDKKHFKPVCAVLGTDNQSNKTQLSYVLLIREAKPKGGKDRDLPVFERIGAGSLPVINIKKRLGKVLIV